jgi:hypothetical protein
VARFRRREIERGIGGERFAELVSARHDTFRGARDECEVLVRARALGPRKRLVQRGAQLPRCAAVIGVFVALHPLR